MESADLLILVTGAASCVVASANIHVMLRQKQIFICTYTQFPLEKALFTRTTLGKVWAVN